MDQMVLILAIALLVWVSAGIGRHTRPAQRKVFAGQDGGRAAEGAPHQKSGSARSCDRPRP